MKTHLELPPLTHSQLEVINGSLLGDASLWHNKSPGTNWKLTKSQSKCDNSGVDKYDYMLWHIKSLSSYSNSKIAHCESHHKMIPNKERKPTTIKLKEITYRGYLFTTHCHPVFTELAKKWYLRDSDGSYVYKNKRKIKIIPPDLKLTPLTLCIWHMDDGYANAKDGNVSLNTQGFTWDECEFLSKQLKEDLDIVSKVRKKDGKQIIYIPLCSYFDFINLIKPYVEWDCFQYKIDTTTYNKSPQIGETHSQATLTNNQIKRIVSLNNKGWSQKQIAEKIKTAKSNISLILSGKRWPHITGLEYKPKKPRITAEIKKMILQLIEAGESQRKIAQRLGVNQSTVSRIKGVRCPT